LEDLEGDSLLGTGLFIVLILKNHQICVWE
jgi:hypothetical protein